MLTIEDLQKRKQELAHQFKAKAQQRSDLQINIQQFQKKLGEINTELLVIDSKSTEISVLLQIAQLTPREKANEVCEA